MRALTTLLEVIKRLIIVVVFWSFINDLLISVFSGSLTNNLMRMLSLPFSEVTLTSLLTIIAFVSALLTMITSNYGLYIATSVVMFSIRTPSLIDLLLVALGLAGLLMIDTYITTIKHKRRVNVSVEGSRIHYLIISVILVFMVVSVTYLTTLYLSMFTSFMNSIPETSPAKVLGLFLSVNPVGRALLILVIVPVFMGISLSFIDAVAYFIIPNPSLAKSELSSAVKHDVEIKYPFYTLMSFIFTAYLAPPAYYALRYLLRIMYPQSLTFLENIAWGSSYSTFLNILIEVLFFLLLWGLLSYVSRFFRGYVSGKLVAVFISLAIFFTVITYFNASSINEFLGMVYYRYYRDLLLVSELLLQLTGFVP